MPYVDTGRISLFFEDAGSGGVPELLPHELGGSSDSCREVIPHLAVGPSRDRSRCALPRPV
jgi:hypothetical protein